MDVLLVFIMAALEIVFDRKKKNCWMEEVYLAITFSKTRLDTYYKVKRLLNQNYFT